ncbi:MAG: FtsX-like permease family protein, partial [Bythopirellula sp.]
ASFLIVALSAFRLAPTEQGTGGFDWIATSDLPLHFDLDTSAGREELGFGARQNKQLADTTIYSFRIHAGEDASCLNLYQTTQPQIVGIPANFYPENQFGWSATSAAGSTWELLNSNLGSDDAGRPVVPMVLDKNTAAYSLHLAGVGARLTIDDSLGQPVTLEVVGLLANSVLQGKIMIDAAQFLRLFPEIGGQQLFLIRHSAGSESTDRLATLLETQLEDFGFDAVSTREKLAGFLAVQNTYLSTFQSLGALGLLLGTLGLAVAQLRSVLERRGELALLRSAGYRRSRLAELVLGENTVLLLGGLAIGTLAALVAVLPHYLLQSAAAPWGTLASLLLAVVLAGVLAGWLAVRATLRVPLLPALRGD